MVLENGEILRYLKRDRHSKLENQEKTTFSKYRLTFDLSELEFSRTNPSVRSESDRTMRVQAMNMMVDTLTSEVYGYAERASKNTSFLQVYGNDNSRPFISTDDINFKHDTLSLENAETMQHATIPGYFVLPFMNKIEHKIRIVDLANGNIEQDNSFFESTSSNILWRLKRISRYLVEIHKKFSIPLACVVFVLIGAPIGMMTRKGNFGYAALISAVILTIFWISLIQGEKLADRLFISPFIGMWAFNIIFSGIGILLILHLTTNVNLKKIKFRRA